jgi:hypothetical protein
MDDEKRRAHIQAAAHQLIELLLSSSPEEVEVFFQAIQEALAELPVNKLNSGIILSGWRAITRNGHGKNMDGCG